MSADDQRNAVSVSASEVISAAFYSQLRQVITELHKAGTGSVPELQARDDSQLRSLCLAGVIEIPNINAWL